jgi:GT2 family glycosyltransferase
MLVSVILPCTKFDEYLIDSIRSILNQTYNDFELIIISSDHSDKFRLDLFNLFPDNRIIIIIVEVKVFIWITMKETII